MSAITDPQPDGFRLSQLLYDTRYRSMTIQIIALVGFLLIIGWLVRNTAQNLAALGKPLGFGFLWDIAGYDINQRLIEYNSQMTHLRAAMVGVLNTLLVAFLGCITATVLGVLIGVLRLSKNWVVARIMTIYIEMFRNVPVLLWILITMAIFIEIFPQPKDFRGADPAATMNFFDSVAITNRGILIPALAYGPGFVLVLITFVLSLIGIVFFRRYARKLQEQTGKILPAGLISLGIFFVPTLVVFLGATMVNLNKEHVIFGAKTLTMNADNSISADGVLRFCDTGGAGNVNAKNLMRANGVKFKSIASYDLENSLSRITSGDTRTGCDIATVPAGTALPEGLLISEGISVYSGRPIELEKPYLAGFNFTDGVLMRNSLIALWFALSLYTAAFIAETVRSGIQAVAKGQTEAAGALGLRAGRITSLVVLPQALRVIIPPMISQYLNLTKNSSLAIAVGYMDITGTLGGITLNQTGREMECLMILMAIYLAISLIISTGMNWYNDRVKLRER
jgi:general L-amino acid transport system permease protein